MPTPLGVIYYNTDLNHVGYSLGRDSVPLCLEVDPSDEEATKSCLMNETSGVLNSFRWADRDFNVEISVVEDFISTFLLDENKPICDDMNRRAEEKDLVFFNAFCKPSEDPGPYIAKQYYRKKDKAAPKNIHEGSRLKPVRRGGHTR